MTVLRVEVRGIPAPQGSKRGFGVRKAGQPTGRVVMVESSTKVKPWREDVRAAAQTALEDWETRHHEPWLPYAGPVHVTALITFIRPKNHYRTGRNSQILRENAPQFVAKAPDLDQILRGIFDALTSSGVWVDDRLVVGVAAVKSYGTASGASLYIRDANPDSGAA